MPELPEVETTRRGLEDAWVGRQIVAATVHDRRLRWPVPDSFEALCTGARVRALRRRAKYLLVDTDRSVIIIHLGMSGSLRITAATQEARLHDHVEWQLDDGRCVRFNDPRRFGSIHLTDDATTHPLLAALGPEPLDDAFNAGSLYASTRGRRVAIKQHIMNAHHVVGVGNIYASEALFGAGITPGRAAGRLTRADCERLAASIKKVLAAAIKVGGTTLRDYIDATGNPGYFRQKLDVYEREGEACRRCDHPIKHRVQGQRSTYWCPSCQR
jgi:formamidopyrimidine-DNA glycosylase